MPVLVDTSVWIAHFRVPLPALAALLGRSDAVTHSVVVGELAVGNLHNRPQTLLDLRASLGALECPPLDALDFLERHRLFGLGRSWGDVQLIADAELNNVPLWTLDKRLHSAAESLGLAWTP